MALPSRRLESTRDRILDGAYEAVARHGLAKLSMSDLGRAAGVSRGTLYRYFATREALLDALARREANRFHRRFFEALGEVPPGEARLHVTLENATRAVREDAALQRLLESDPAYVLSALRKRLPDFAEALHAHLGSLFSDSEPVRRGVASPHQLADWMVRFLISFYLFPDPEIDATLQAFTALCRILALPGGTGATAALQHG